MKTRKKLKLAQLSVKSFVTLDNAFLKETIKGGSSQEIISNSTLPTGGEISEGPPSTDSTSIDTLVTNS